MFADSYKIREFAAEQRSLLKIERDDEEEQLRELLKASGLSKLVKLGLCIPELKVRSVRVGMFDKPVISLEQWGFEKHKLQSGVNLEYCKLYKDGLKVRKGDMVGIYPWTNNDSFLQNKPLLTGVVDDFSTFKIKVSCHESEEFDVYGNWSLGHFCIVQMINDITFKRYRECLDRLEYFASRPESPVYSLIHTMFGLEKTLDFVEKTPIEIPYFDDSLNEYQKRAVRMSLACDHFSLIHGPPGTGKTKTVVETIKHFAKKKKSIIVTAASNVAVDNILERLIDSGLSFIRIGNPSRTLERVAQKYSLDYLVGIKVKASAEYRSMKRELSKLESRRKKLHKEHSYSKEIKAEKREVRNAISNLNKDLNNLRRVIVNEIIGGAQIILSTQTGALDRVLTNWMKEGPEAKSTKYGNEDKLFDVAILDEAAQSMEVSSWVLILMAKKAILAGDHKQLPPTVKSKEAEKKGLGNTLFDRLAKLCDLECTI